METYIIIGILVIAAFIAKAVYDKKNHRIKLVAKLRKEWGDVPNQAYSPEKLASISFFYKKVVKTKEDVDDITWNDLDMDQIYMTVNNTSSAIGEEYLYAVMRHIQFNDQELAERHRLADFFSKNEEARLQVQEALLNMGKTKTLSVYEYMNRLHDVTEESNMGHMIKILLLLGAIGTIFVEPFMGIIASLVMLGVNIFTYFKRKNEIERYFAVVSYIIRWLDSARVLSGMKIPALAAYTKDLEKISKHFKSFRAGATVVAPKNGSGDLVQMFVDYFRMMFHLDLIKFNSMIKVFKNHQKDLNDMFVIIGLLDTTIAIASFRELMVDYCIPELSLSPKIHLNAEEIYHPMLNDPVKNTIKEARSVLITGSNASGKSTFIKTLAINAILSQTLYTAMCDSYQASYFKVLSSMALQDNLQSGESYYIVEIKSLKRILDSVETKIPTLCFVDEVLRGTNTLERIAASSRILHNLAVSNTMCFAATHDIELTQILEKFYSNYHFQEQVVGNDILFDYILHEGRAVSKNAIKLLHIIGYSDDIIEDAMNAANEFLEKGEWSALPEACTA